jgi:uncharacterized protein YjeT (DUF2065 family)
MERVALLFGAVFILAGACVVIWPMNGYILHPGSGHYADRASRPALRLTKTGARSYGFVLVSVGTGLAWLALHRFPK